MVGEVQPRLFVVQGGLQRGEVAGVDAVETEHRHACGKGFRPLAVPLDKHFLHAGQTAEADAGFVPPVVKVAGQYQRAARIDVGGNVFEEGGVLFGAVGFAQIQVGAQANQRVGPVFRLDFAM